MKQAFLLLILLSACTAKYVDPITGIQNPDETLAHLIERNDFFFLRQTETLLNPGKLMNINAKGSVRILNDPNYSRVFGKKQIKIQKDELEKLKLEQYVDVIPFLNKYGFDYYPTWPDVTHYRVHIQGAEFKWMLKEPIIERLRTAAPWDLENIRKYHLYILEVYGVLFIPQVTVEFAKDPTEAGWQPLDVAKLGTSHAYDTEIRALDNYTLQLNGQFVIGVLAFAFDEQNKEIPMTPAERERIQKLIAGE